MNATIETDVARAETALEAARAARLDRVRALAADGLSDPEIAALLEVAPATVRTIRRRAGIEPGRPAGSGPPRRRDGGWQEALRAAHARATAEGAGPGDFGGRVMTRPLAGDALAHEAGNVITSVVLTVRSLRDALDEGRPVGHLVERLLGAEDRLGAILDEIKHRQREADGADDYRAPATAAQPSSTHPVG